MSPRVRFSSPFDDLCGGGGGGGGGVKGGEAARWGRRGGVLYARPSQGGTFGASSPTSARSGRKARGGAVPRGG
jgi:hypothetical protein